MIRLTLRRVGATSTPDELRFFVKPSDISAIQALPGFSCITLTSGREEMVEETASVIMTLKTFWNSTEDFFPVLREGTMRPLFVYMSGEGIQLQMIPIEKMEEAPHAPGPNNYIRSVIEMYEEQFHALS